MGPLRRGFLPGAGGITQGGAFDIRYVLEQFEKKDVVFWIIIRSRKCGLFIVVLLIQSDIP
jgi:hypothetical protein